MIAEMNRVENAARIAMGGVPEIGGALATPRGMIRPRMLFILGAVIICVLVGYGIS